MRIGGLLKTTLIDYPGELACIVFLRGCNFRCPFCYSKELVTEDNGFDLDTQEFFDFLEKRKNQLGACVICGGEPTINPELFDFCKKIKEFGYKVKLDTNGSNSKMIKELVENNLIDYIAMDVKAPFDKYNKAIGTEVDIKEIKQSIELIKTSGVDYEFRTTIVPDIHSLEDIKIIAEEISPAKKYFVQNFRNDKELLDKNFQDKIAFKDHEIQKVINEIKDNFENCYLR